MYASERSASGKTASIPAKLALFGTTVPERDVEIQSNPTHKEPAWQIC
jgi:hypothetical protein